MFKSFISWILRHSKEIDLAVYDKHHAQEKQAHDELQGKINRKRLEKEEYLQRLKDEKEDMWKRLNEAHLQRLKKEDQEIIDSQERLYQAKLKAYHQRLKEREEEKVAKRA